MPNSWTHPDDPRPVRWMYGGPRIHAKLAAEGLICRLTSTGAINALCESFFATLECKLLDRRQLATHIESRFTVLEPIDGWQSPTVATPPWTTSTPVSFEKTTGHLTGKPVTLRNRGDSNGSHQRGRALLSHPGRRRVGEGAVRRRPSRSAPPCPFQR
jgi:hypothetical protein